MFIKNNERVSLRRYWTSRYLITLCVGLMIIAFISASWIRYSTLTNRLNTMEWLTEDFANRIVHSDHVGPPLGADVPGGLPDSRRMGLESEPYIYIVKTNGQVVSANRSVGPFGKKVDLSVIQSEETVQKLPLGKDSTNFFVVKSAITHDEETIGWVVMAESKKQLAKVKHEYTLLAIMIISLALLGWGAIYFLTARLSRPIKEVAQAAKQVKEGEYQIQLPQNNKAEEVYELIASFKEMANRLEQLESLRTELLAGVTHELKTPVTSISGLLQALNDEVVSGEEAKEFLEISLKETSKMRTMIEDLLAFNSFAACAIPLNMEKVNVNHVVKNIIHTWKVSQEEDIIITTSLLNTDVAIEVDVIRLEQITINLLNNAKQAMQAGEIKVTVTLNRDEVIMDVANSGPAIPLEEQPFIFERFYRGEGKKYKVRGLGLGLSLSKMIAQAMNGDLTLKQSDHHWTVFRISLPRNEKQL